jgi:hypothetical protein
MNTNQNQNQKQLTKQKSAKFKIKTKIRNSPRVSAYQGQMNTNLSLLLNQLHEPKAREIERFTNLVVVVVQFREWERKVWWGLRETRDVNSIERRFWLRGSVRTEDWETISIERERVNGWENTMGLGFHGFSNWMSERVKTQVRRFRWERKRLCACAFRKEFLMLKGVFTSVEHGHMWNPYNLFST